MFHSELVLKLVVICCMFNLHHLSLPLIFIKCCKCFLFVSFTEFKLVSCFFLSKVSILLWLHFRFQNSPWLMSHDSKALFNLKYPSVKYNNICSYAMYIHIFYLWCSCINIWIKELTVWHWCVPRHILFIHFLLLTALVLAWLFFSCNSSMLAVHWILCILLVL